MTASTATVPIAEVRLTTHAAVYNTFYTQPHLISRTTLRKFRGEALRVWREATASEYRAPRGLAGQDQVNLTRLAGPMGRSISAAILAEAPLRVPAMPAAPSFLCWGDVRL